MTAVAALLRGGFDKSKRMPPLLSCCALESVSEAFAFETLPACVSRLWHALGPMPRTSTTSFWPNAVSLCHALRPNAFLCGQMSAMLPPKQLFRKLSAITIKRREEGPPPLCFPCPPPLPPPSFPSLLSCPSSTSFLLGEARGGRGSRGEQRRLVEQIAAEASRGDVKGVVQEMQRSRWRRAPVGCTALACYHQDISSRPSRAQVPTKE